MLDEILENQSVNSEKNNTEINDNEIDYSSQDIVKNFKNSDNNDEQIGAIIKAAKTSVHSGPLPAPGMFQEYEKVLPGAADRIMAMAEKEANHRHPIDE